MATLPRDFRVHNAYDQSEADKSARAQKHWPPEGASLVVVLATVVTCFLVVWTGLALVTWHVINMRQSEGSGAVSTNGVSTQNGTTPTEYPGDGDTLYDDRIIDWPDYPGDDFSFLLFWCWTCSVQGRVREGLGFTPQTFAPVGEIRCKARDLLKGFSQFRNW